jgi:hypothetical protein
MPIDGLTATVLEDASLVVFGSPTHYQNLPKTIRAALDALPKRVLRGKRVAAFDTSLEMWGPLMWMTAAHSSIAVRLGAGLPTRSPIPRKVPSSPCRDTKRHHPSSISYYTMASLIKPALLLNADYLAHAHNVQVQPKSAGSRAYKA